LEDIQAQVSKAIAAQSGDNERIEEICEADAPPDGLKPFPVEALPDRRLIDEIDRTHKVSANFTAPLMLGTISMTLGRGIAADSFLRDGQRTMPNLYLLIVAESGAGKSVSALVMRPVIDTDHIIKMNWQQNRLPQLIAREKILNNEITVVLKPPRGNERKQEDADVTSGLHTDEAREKKLAMKLAELQVVKDELDMPRGLLVQNTTSEKLAIFLSQNKGTGSLFSADASDVIANILGRYRSKQEVDDGLFLAAYSGDHYSQQRVGRPEINLIDPCLSMTLLTQPDRLDSLVNNQRVREGGLLPRFLLVCPDDPQSKLDRHAVLGVNPISSDVLRHHNGVVTALTEAFRVTVAQTIPINAEPAARMVFRDYHNACIDRQEKRPDLRACPKNQSGKIHT
jgi:hypothetical protein